MTVTKSHALKRKNGSFKASLLNEHYFIINLFVIFVPERKLSGNILAIYAFVGKLYSLCSITHS